MSPRETDTCPLCGTARSLADAGGMCPGCLLGAVLDPGFTEQPMEPDVQPGECGGYRLEREIGRGGTGVVFLARLPGIERPFALKMPAARFAGPEDIRRFRIEVESVAGLDHPNIVPLHSAGEEDGRPYFVMKYAAGGTLQSILQARGGVVTSGVRREDVICMVKVARAVQFAHERGVLHRDIKPANILIDDSREPLVSDFGLARMLHAPHGATLTGSAIGTPAYMAPEQASGGTVTTAADVYSLGAVLFHLLTGRPPFDRSSPLETLRRVATEDAADPRTLTPGLDRDLATVCLKCLHRDPKRRHASAAEFADDMERWLRGEPVHARRAGYGERLLKWARRRPAMAALMFSTGIASVAIVALLFGGSAMLRKERNEAVRQEALAHHSAGMATESAEAFRQNAYAADIYLASRALEDGQLGVARGMLDRHLPEGGTVDLRGFEWHALRRMCQGTEARVFREHEAAVTAVAFDPTGRLLASAGRDGKLIVHEADSGKSVLSLPRPDAPKGAAEIPTMSILTARSPEARSMLLSGDLNTDELRMCARPSKLGEFTTIAWSPDGKLLATGSSGAFVRLWKMPEGEMTAYLPMSQILKLEFSDDGNLLVSLQQVGDRFDIRIHRVGDLAPLRMIRDVEPCFAQAGGDLAFMDHQTQRMIISDLESGVESNAWSVGTGISALAFSADRARLDAIDQTGTKRTAWSAADGRVIDEQESPSGVLRALAVSADGSFIATAGTGQSIYLTRPGVGGAQKRFAGHEDEILDLTISADHRWIASAGNDHTIRLWVLNPHKPTVSQAAWATRRVVASSPDSLSWLSEAKSGGVFLTKLDGVARELPASAGSHALCYDGTGGQVITWRQDGGSAIIEWWKTETLTLADTRTIPVDTAPPWLLAIGAHGRFCAVTGNRSPVWIHDLTTGELVHQFQPPADPVWRMEVSPDAERLMVFAWPRQIQMGRMGGGFSAPWKLTGGTLGPVVFSPDGRWIASGGDDNRISIREVESGRLIQELVGHRAGLLALAFSPDGRTLVSAGEDKTLRLWHTATWRDLGVLVSGVSCRWISFGKTGSHLLVMPDQASPFIIQGNND